jgi:hypothetical protein
LTTPCQHADFAEEWRYYNDRKSWLLKVTEERRFSGFRCSRTLSRLAHSPWYKTAIRTSALSADLKEQLQSNKIGKLRGIIITFKKKSDVENAKRLIALKLS